MTDKKTSVSSKSTRGTLYSTPWLESFIKCNHPFFFILYFGSSIKHWLILNLLPTKSTQITNSQKTSHFCSLSDMNFYTHEGFVFEVRLTQQPVFAKTVCPLVSSIKSRRVQCLLLSALFFSIQYHVIKHRNTVAVWAEFPAKPMIYSQ